MYSSYMLLMLTGTRPEIVGATGDYLGLFMIFFGLLGTPISGVSKKPLVEFPSVLVCS